LKTKLIILFFLVISKTIYADSITLTCDFKYSKHSGISMEIPANCSSKVSSLLLKEYKEKNKSYPIFLPRELFVNAVPPICPQSYAAVKEYQGGVIAAFASRTRLSNGNQTLFYQIRRICIKNHNNERKKVSRHPWASTLKN
jgi:hypothetical protein